jgi:CheY-like chemotaxis protein
MKHPKGSRKAILVVEDEPSISQVCLRTLNADGFDVDIAINGVIAQDMLAKKEYDLCLIDIRTPVMNGRELYQHIKEEHPESAKKSYSPAGISWIINWSCSSRKPVIYIYPSRSLPTS